MIRTRYAPSPTGFLHIGGARTALFNYVFAKRHHGKFILRIEDTDEVRNIEGGHISLDSDLKFLGIFPDESFFNPGSKGPYLQSQKRERYLELCEELLNNGRAYRCFCSEKELEEAKNSAIANNSPPFYSRKCRSLTEEEIQAKLDEEIPYTVRLKVDLHKEYKWNDLVRGEIVFQEHSLQDYVIMRSNKVPTYNFAVVVDDHDMEINYVLRGEEHISNTPFQLATYYALGWEDSIPQIGHLSVIVDEDKKKLSKRSANELYFISGLDKKGYPAEAIFNFLALLGWSNGEEEIFSMDEIIKSFNVENLSPSPAFYDVKKLNWISRKYFQNMSSSNYLNFVKYHFTVDLGEFNSKKEFFALANKKNINHASQLNEMALEFYSPRTLAPKDISFLKEHVHILNLAKDYFPANSESWDSTTIRNYLKQLMQISGIKGRDFFRPLRLAFSLLEEGFELINVMECLGRDVLTRNLDNALTLIKGG